MDKDEINEKVLSEEVAGSDLELAEREEAIANRKAFEKNIKNLWGYSNKGIEAKKAAMSALATSTGMYARIPLICKGDKCPYASMCNLLKYDLAPVGEPCPDETALIEVSHVEYDRQFDLDSASFTDKNLVATIINYDIMIKRTETLIAKEQDPVNQIVAGVNEVTGEEYTQPEVSKYVTALDGMVRKRNELYQLMMATRKDKKDDNENKEDLSTIIDKVIEADFVVESRPEEFE